MAAYRGDAVPGSNAAACRLHLAVYHVTAHSGAVVRTAFRSIPVAAPGSWVSGVTAAQASKLHSELFFHDAAWVATYHVLDGTISLSLALAIQAPTNPKP